MDASPLHCLLLSLSPLYLSHFHIPPPKQVHGNGRGVIERCFIRGDLNVSLCVRGELGWGWELFGDYSVKEAWLPSLSVHLARSSLASLFKKANFGDTRGGGG